MIANNYVRVIVNHKRADSENNSISARKATTGEYILCKSSLMVQCFLVFIYQLFMLPNNVCEGLRMALAIPGNSLQNKLQLLLILGQVSENW